MSIPTIRPQAKRYRALLAKHFLVRFHMSLILAAVMAVAVLSSKTMLLAGLNSLPVRYPLAAIAGYLVFLGLVRIWVAFVTRNKISFRQRARRSVGDIALNTGLGLISDDGTSVSSPVETVHFGGGSSGGGGASRSFEVDAGGSSEGGSSWMPDVSFDIDDGGWILIVLGILLAVIFGAGTYLIYVAPEMLPEVAAQVVLASALKRASTKLEQGDWAMSLIGGTIVPFLLILLMTIGLGVVAHRSCPQATKLADAISCPQS